MDTSLLSVGAEALLLAAALAFAAAVAYWRPRSAVARPPSDAAAQVLAFALAGMDAAFIVVDRQGRITQFNARAEALTGWARIDALGKDLWRVLERDDRPADATPANAVDAMLARGTPS
jgi:PAS domain-containing protein